MSCVAGCVYVLSLGDSLSIIWLLYMVIVGACLRYNWYSFLKIWPVCEFWVWHRGYWFLLFVTVTMMCNWLEYQIDFFVILYCGVALFCSVVWCVSFVGLLFDFGSL